MFRNTCFIAVVAQLRHLLQPVMESVRQYRWNDYIMFVRSMSNQKYGYTTPDQGDGQHDAAELLGDILHEYASDFGVEIRKNTVMYECNCNDSTESVECLAMIVLPLPPAEGRYRLSDLQDTYFSPVEVNDLLCDECGCRSNGLFTHTYNRSLSGKLVFRINRYSTEGRRPDEIDLDKYLTFDNGEEEYRLEAILQHHGRSAHQGHYIIFLFINGVWECHNDDDRTFFNDEDMPPYSPEDVYVVVYGLTNPVDSSLRDESSNPRSTDDWGNIPEDPIQTRSYGLPDETDYWSTIQEDPSPQVNDSDSWTYIPEETTKFRKNHRI